MAVNHKLAKIVTGRVIRNFQQNAGELAISFHDGSALKIRERRQKVRRCLLALRLSWWRRMGRSSRSHSQMIRILSLDGPIRGLSSRLGMSMTKLSRLDSGHFSWRIALSVRYRTRRSETQFGCSPAPASHSCAARSLRRYSTPAAMRCSRSLRGAGKHLPENQAYKVPGLRLRYRTSQPDALRLAQA